MLVFEPFMHDGAVWFQVRYEGEGNVSAQLGAWDAAQMAAATRTIGDALLDGFAMQRAAQQDAEIAALRDKVASR